MKNNYLSKYESAKKALDTAKNELEKVGYLLSREALIDAIMKEKKRLDDSDEEFKNTGCFTVEFYLDFYDELRAICSFEDKNFILQICIRSMSEEQVQRLYDLNFEDENTIKVVDEVLSECYVYRHPTGHLIELCMKAIASHSAKEFKNTGCFPLEFYIENKK